ncbi:MAG: DUF5666 domain-containing protein [Chloroflexota bacterium]|nr:DUF5666 domain-containing protein [Chloroflexota bacterium]
MFSTKIKAGLAGLGVLAIVAGGVIATPHNASAAGHTQATSNGIIRATGKISALQGSTGFTLQGAKATYTVNLGTNTWIVVAKDGKPAQGAAGDLTVGETVNVAGTGTASQIDARVVTDAKVAAKVGTHGAHGAHGKAGKTGKLAHEHATVVTNAAGTLTLSSGKNNKTETVNTDAGTIVLKGGLATVADLKAGDVVNVTPRHMMHAPGTTAPATTPGAPTGKVKATPTAELITVVSDTNQAELGVVKSVDGNTVTVRTLHGEQKVTVSSTAAFRSVTAGSSSAPASAALSDLKAGSRVLLYGAKAATGQTLTANVVLILGQATK